MVERASFLALEYDSFSFTQSVLNCLDLRHNLLYNVLRGAKAKVVAEGGVSFWQKLASVVLAAPLGVLSVPATILAAALRSGATMAISARKD